MNNKKQILTNKSSDNKILIEMSKKQMKNIQYRFRTK